MFVTFPEDDFTKNPKHIALSVQFKMLSEYVAVNDNTAVYLSSYSSCCTC
jgi:hypothetical protein